MRKTIVVLMAIALLAALAMPMFAAEMAKSESWTGWITDSHCAAKGANAKHTAECAEKCVKEGGKLVFFNNGDKKIYGIDKQDEAMKHIGHEVKVTGTLTGDQIAVTSFDMAK